ncbi:MAG: FAD-binding oxidoreductase [Dehalococcoidia bacterium]|nr:FAD-binding oxidoreductase [Dehalococcoidia bacterium]
MGPRRLLAGVAALALIGSGAVATRVVLEDSAEPEGPKDCGDALPVVAPLPLRSVSTSNAGSVAEPGWAQRGGTINDASCLSQTTVAGIVSPRSAEEVAQVLAYARERGLTVSAAGVKHSMGGQAFRRGGIVLDMTQLADVRLDEARGTVTVGAGATWHAIQEAIHPRFAVKAMQSSDIFSVGGSIAVNAHGMDHQAGALMRSIRSLQLMLADGSIVTVSPSERPELFRHVVGGYGLFGIVLTAELDVVPNDIYESDRTVIEYRDFPRLFESIEADRDIGLMYVHLSTAPGSLLREGIVYTYRRVDDTGLERQPLAEASSTKLRRLLLNLSKRNDFLKTTKWWAERHLEPRFESCTVTRAQAMGEGEACLVSRNDPMHDSVPYLRNALPRETDILHEYFLPRAELVGFLDELREVLERREANLLNASVRVVHGEANALTYAPEPAFSVVLYINQSTDAEGNDRMAALTSELIDLTARHRGRFFLPYQLHYTAEQLVRSYPELPAFLEVKRQWDPDGLFSNTWYARYAPQVAGTLAARAPEARGQ